MFISLSTWLYDHLPFKEVAEHVKKCGYNSVEISGNSWHSIWDWQEILKETKKAGIKITSIHCVHHELPNWLEDEKMYRKYHEEFYKKITGAEGAIMVEHITMRRGYINRTQSQLDFLAQLCSQNNYVLSTENMPEAPNEQMETLSSVVKNRVYLTLDGVHSAACGIDPLKFNFFFDRVVNVHVYDIPKPSAPFNARPGLGDWLPCGLGELDWKGIICTLKKSEYKGPLTVELNERLLRSVISICHEATETITGEKEEGSYLDIEDKFAIYSKKHLEKILKEV